MRWIELKQKHTKMHTAEHTSSTYLKNIFAVIEKTKFQNACKSFLKSTYNNTMYKC